VFLKSVKLKEKEGRKEQGSSWLNKLTAGNLKTYIRQNRLSISEKIPYVRI